MHYNKTRISTYYNIVRSSKSFSLFIYVKAISKLTMEHSVKFENKFEKLSVVVHVPQTTQNLIISRGHLAEDGKEMYQGL